VEFNLSFPFFEGKMLKMGWRVSVLQHSII